MNVFAQSLAKKCLFYYYGGGILNTGLMMQNLLELIQIQPSLANLNKLTYEQLQLSLSLYIKFDLFDAFHLVVELQKQNQLDLLIPIHACTKAQFMQLMTAFSKKRFLSLKLAYVLIIEFNFDDSFFNIFLGIRSDLKEKIELILLEMHQFGLLNTQFIRQLCRFSEIEETIHLIYSAIQIVKLYQAEINASQLQKFFNQTPSELAQISQFVHILQARSVSLSHYINHIKPITEEQSRYLNHILQHWPLEQISHQDFLQHIFSRQHHYELIHQHAELYSHLLKHFSPQQVLLLLNIPIREFEIFKPLMPFIDLVKTITYERMHAILSANYPALVFSAYFLNESLGFETNLIELGLMHVHPLMTHVQFLQKLQALNQDGEIFKLVTHHQFDLAFLIELTEKELLQHDFLIASHKIDSQLLKPVVRYLLNHQNLTVSNLESCFKSDNPYQAAEFISNPDTKKNFTASQISLCCEHHQPSEVAQFFLDYQRSNHFTTDMFNRVLQFTSTNLKLTILNTVEMSVLLENHEILSQIRQLPELGAALFALNVIKKTSDTLVFQKIVSLYDKRQLHEIINLFINTNTNRNHLERILLYPEIANLVWLFRFYCSTPDEEINFFRFIDEFPTNFFQKESIRDYIFAFDDMRFTQDMLHFQLCLHRHVTEAPAHNPFFNQEHLTQVMPSVAYQKQHHMLIPFLIEAIDEMVNEFANRDNLQHRLLFQLILNQNIVIDVQRQLSIWGILVYMLNTMNQNYPQIAHQQHLSILSASLYMMLVNAQVQDLNLTPQAQFLGLLLRGDLSSLIDDIQFRLRQIVNPHEVFELSIDFSMSDEGEGDEDNGIGLRS